MMLLFNMKQLTNKWNKNQKYNILQVKFYFSWKYWKIVEVLYYKDAP